MTSGSVALPLSRRSLSVKVRVNGTFACSLPSPSCHRASLQPSPAARRLRVSRSPALPKPSLIRGLSRRGILDLPDAIRAVTLARNATSRVCPRDCSWGGNFSLFLAVPFPVIAIAFPVIFCERTGKKYPKNQRRRGTRRRLSIRKSRFPCIFPCFYRRDRFAADCVVSQRNQRFRPSLRLRQAEPISHGVVF